jgi:hypothetical protein
MFGQKTISWEPTKMMVSPDGGPLVFDYQYGGNVAASSYIDAANTNLFYMNIMHDVWYQYGFNEANGNFQENIKKGGLAGDL